MRSLRLGTVIAAAVLLTTPIAYAQTSTTITKETSPGGVEVRESTGVKVKESTTETTGTVVTPSSGCKSKTTHKTDEFGDTKTEHKEKCD